MSLSPRPESVTTMVSDFLLFLATFTASAIAWDDSKAGMIPSVLVSNRNASHAATCRQDLIGDGSAR